MCSNNVQFDDNVIGNHLWASIRASSTRLSTAYVDNPVGPGGWLPVFDRDHSRFSACTTVLCTLNQTDLLLTIDLIVQAGNAIRF